MNRTPLRALLLAVVSALAVPVLAGPALAADPRAEALFREGREAMERGEHDVACGKFEESLSLEQAIGPLLNLAECN